MESKCFVNHKIQCQQILLFYWKNSSTSWSFVVKFFWWFQYSFRIMYKNIVIKVWFFSRILWYFTVFYISEGLWLYLYIKTCFLFLQLNEALESSRAEVTRLHAEREHYEETMKKAFMRGVCALNLEAMHMFHENEGKKVFIICTICQHNMWLYCTFTEEQSLVLGWAGMMGIIVMCFLLE